MKDEGNTVYVGITGLLTSLTLQQINAFLAFLVAVATLVYVCYGIGNRRMIRKRLQAETKQARQEEPSGD